MSRSSTAARAWELYQAGQLPQAEQLALAVLHAEPTNAQVVCLLGAIYQAQGRRSEAITSYLHAIRLAPHHAEAHNNLGAALAQDGKSADAVTSFRQAIRIHPGFAEAHNNLGCALRGLGQLGESVHHLRQAVGIKPDYADAHFNLGLSLMRQDQFAEAESSFREALHLRPDHLPARHHLGLALMRQERLDEAVACFESVIRERPAHADAINDLGYTLRKQGCYAEAMSCFDRALTLQPDHAPTHHNRALLRLLLGDFEQGWAEYEWRWRCPEFPAVKIPRPRWNGNSLAGQTILLHTEQGFGDAFQFIRYAPLLKQQGARVLLACAARLVPILSTCPGIDHALAKGDPVPPFDVHAPLLSLPSLCRTTLTSVPVPIPYLGTDAALAHRWRQELSAAPGFKVGICWQGSPGYREDAYRSMPLACFAPLASVEGVRLYSLQKGPGVEQLAELAGPFEIIDLGSRLDEATGAFMETAAVIQALDLVVTCDSAIGHLAGALGRPVWIAIPQIPDYRWMLKREDSPWYPTARLFRQQRLGRWDDVFARLAAAVKPLASSSG